ncbi:MAG: HAMP domain-containing protein [Alphaproteobacteria bacterium]|nr:HAMP domain-containing protein [Alphaproteobacteria bacterium]
MPPPTVPHLDLQDRAEDSTVLRVLRSTGFRLAVLHTAVFIVSAMALVAFIYWATAGAVNRQIDAAIRADVLALADRYREGGHAGLVEAIERRITEDADNEAMYILIDSDGRRVAGNVDRWPAIVPGEEWFELQLERGGDRSVARAYQFLMPGGYRLLVGRDAQERIRLRDLIVDALLWAMAMIMVFAVLGGVLVRRMLLKRMQDVSETAMTISQGNLSRRVATGERGDEFDMLGRTVNRMLDQIERLMNGVREVSNAIAHDLRTPIARVRARLEEGLRQPPDAAADRATLERTIAELDNVIAIFQALLRIAEIEAGARRAAFATVDLSRLLADAVEIYSASAEEKGQRMSLEVPAGLRIVGDRDLILQAVANLLDNAVKYTPGGGSILLSGRALGGEAEIIVADTGQGLPEAERARVTERFYRTEQSRSTPGSGLGLALVQAVAQLHNGSLRFEDNAPGLRAVLTL